MIDKGKIGSQDFSLDLILDQATHAWAWAWLNKQARARLEQIITIVLPATRKRLVLYHFVAYTNFTCSIVLHYTSHFKYQLNERANAKE